MLTLPIMDRGRLKIGFTLPNSGSMHTVGNLWITDRFQQKP